MIKKFVRSFLAASVAFFFAQAGFADAQTLLGLKPSAPPPAPAACSSGPLDVVAGTWTEGWSMRVLQAATTATKSFQIQNSNGAATLDIPWNVCDADMSVVGSFCQTATLSVTSTSASVAVPAGTNVWVINTGTAPLYYNSGSGSVTASTSTFTNLLLAGESANIPITTQTNVAAITNANFTGSIALTNCGVSKRYNQIAIGKDFVQATASNQPTFLASCTANGKPCIVGCQTCFMTVADDASFKTTTIHQFFVGAFSINPITTTGINFVSIGYPQTTNSTATALRWGISNASNEDQIEAQQNSNGGAANPEGAGAVYRGNITVWDYSTTDGISRFNNTQFSSSAGAVTITYPNAVGLYMGRSSSSATPSAPGMWVEDVIASAAVTGHATLVTNEMSYFGITAPTTSPADPLGLGFTWSPYYIGSFNPFGATVTINGNTYSTEGSWNLWSEWKATNVSTAGTSLGDMMRFERRQYDIWDGTNRSELDGKNSVDYGQDVDIWSAYAIYIEPGVSFVPDSWSIFGQWHNEEDGSNCCQISTNLSADTFIWTTFIGAAATVRYTSPTITRGVWYHVVQKYRVSSSGSGDTYDLWADYTSPGTMVHVVTVGASHIFSTTNIHQYWKYGNYAGSTGAVPQTTASRWANMQACTAGANCTSLYGVTDLSALTTTPRDNPSHL